MRYFCSICGYVYDEEAEGTPFDALPDTWKCPVCGAGKDAFQAEAAQAPAPPSTEPPAGTAPVPAAPSAVPVTGDLTELPDGVIAAICSNLARGCEKQYHPTEQALFTELATYYTERARQAREADGEGGRDDGTRLAAIASALKADLEERYPAVHDAAIAQGDRGTQRACVWGEKVTRALLSLAERYQREGKQMLEGTRIWVCSVCGFTYIGPEPPALCPVCKVPAWKFDEIKGRVAL